MPSISDEKIIEIYQRLLQDEHPDPLGFIARGDIKTQLNPDGRYKDYVGAFGVHHKLAKALGYEDDDLINTDAAYQATLDVDLNNYRLAEDDLDEMYRLSNKASDNSTERFLTKLDEKRKYYSGIFIFEDGLPIKINRDQSTPPNLKTPEALSNHANTLGPEIILQADELLNKLIKLVVAEKPIYG